MTFAVLRLSVKNRCLSGRGWIRVSWISCIKLTPFLTLMAPMMLVVKTYLAQRMRRFLTMMRQRRSVFSQQDLSRGRKPMCCCQALRRSLKINSYMPTHHVSCTKSKIQVVHERCFKNMPSALFGLTRQLGR